MTTPMIIRIKPRNKSSEPVQQTHMTHDIHYTNHYREVLYMYTDPAQSYVTNKVLEFFLYRLHLHTLQIRLDSFKRK